MLRDVLEKPAARELASQDQRGAAAERCQRAQNLGRTPIERPKIVDAVVGGHVQSVRGRLDIGEQFAECQHHAFRPVAGAGGEQDAGIVLRPRARQSYVRRLASGNRLVKAGSGSVVEQPQRQTRRRCLCQDVSEIQPRIEHGEPWVQRRQNLRKVPAVHLDMDGADGGTISHHAEITGQVLDRVAGEQGDAVVAADAARGQKRGDLPGQPPQLPVADRASIVDRNNIGLVRIARGRAIDPVTKQVWPKLSFFQHVTSYGQSSRWAPAKTPGV